MIDFGYGIAPSSTINLDNVDRNAVEELCRRDPGFRECIACGSCTASCSAGKYVHTSVRSALHHILNGRNDKAREMLSACMFCGKCLLVCPRGLNTRHMILEMSKYLDEK